MSGVGSSVVSRCATANTTRSPLRAASIARNVPGRPAAIGAVNPGKMTVPRSGRTGRVWRVAIVLPEVNEQQLRTSRVGVLATRTPYSSVEDSVLRGAPELIGDWRHWRQKEQATSGPSRSVMLAGKASALALGWRTKGQVGRRAP